MLEVIANIEDDVYAAVNSKRKKGLDFASGTDVGCRKQKVVIAISGEPLVMQPSPPPDASAAFIVPHPLAAPVAPSIPLMPCVSKQAKSGECISCYRCRKPKPATPSSRDLPVSGNTKQRSRHLFQPVRLMKGHDKFDFIRNLPVAGFNWGDLINLTPIIKGDMAKGQRSTNGMDQCLVCDK